MQLNVVIHNFPASLEKLMDIDTRGDLTARGPLVLRWEKTSLSPMWLVRNGRMISKFVSCSFCSYLIKKCYSPGNLTVSSREWRASPATEANLLFLPTDNLSIWTPSHVNWFTLSVHVLRFSTYTRFSWLRVSCIHSAHQCHMTLYNLLVHQIKMLDIVLKWSLMQCIIVNWLI